MNIPTFSDVPDPPPPHLLYKTPFNIALLHIPVSHKYFFLSSSCLEFVFKHTISSNNATCCSHFAHFIVVTLHQKQEFVFKHTISSNNATCCSHFALFNVVTLHQKQEFVFKHTISTNNATCCSHFALFNVVTLHQKQESRSPLQ
jgi:sRNA-binding regulator protein Hfq